MNLAKINHIKRITLLVLLVPLVIGLLLVVKKNRESAIYAVDPLVVTYEGHNPPDPMFDVHNMLPGDCEEKTFNVKNDGSGSEIVLMSAFKVFEYKNFGDILDILITNNLNQTVLNGKLKDFFNVINMNIGTFASGENRDYKVKVCFPDNSGNEFSEAKVVFNIKWQTNLVLTPTPTKSPSPTVTPKPSLTPKPSPTKSPSLTPRPTETPKPTPTRRPFPTFPPFPTPPPHPTPPPFPCSGHETFDNLLELIFGKNYCHHD